MKPKWISNFKSEEVLFDPCYPEFYPQFSVFCTLYYSFVCRLIKSPSWLLPQKSNQLSISESRKIKSASALILNIKHCCEWMDIMDLALWRYSQRLKWTVFHLPRCNCSFYKTSLSWCTHLVFLNVSFLKIN